MRSISQALVNGIIPALARQDVLLIKPDRYIVLMQVPDQLFDKSLVAPRITDEYERHECDSLCCHAEVALSHGFGFLTKSRRGVRATIHCKSSQKTGLTS